MDIVWLASYPRSGNTWLRFLLYTYLHGPIENTADVNKAIPAVHRHPTLDPTEQGRVLMKTHFECTPRHPMLDRTSGFIHIRRHPKDVLLSGLDYLSLNGMSLDAKVYAKAFIALRGDPGWHHSGFGTWESHIGTWLDAPVARCHWTTYERLKKDAAGEMRLVLEFLGEPIDESRLTAAIEQCSFEKLRETEEREKSGAGRSLFPGVKAAREKGHRFINRGATGQTLHHIDPDLDAKFDEVFGPILERRGYPAV